MTPSGYVDEDRVEATIREILAPLDRAIDRSDAVVGGALVLLGVVAWLALWFVAGWSWWGSLLAGLGAMIPIGIVVGGLGVAYDSSRVRVAVRAFNECFPEGSAEREAALAMLLEMDSPSKAEGQLREALQPSDSLEAGERIVRRRRVDAVGPSDKFLKDDA